ncbi:MAG: alpha-ribazole phosphatase family protein [Chitinophagaceae bacterium]|nr:alpha-ribazole phosphatase family protein [Chitinophagaceae bacterium]
MPHLVRHTTPLIAAGICYGWSNLDVADTFLAEVEAVTAALPPNIDCIYSSPLQRCAKLAACISARTGVEELYYDDALKEMHFGAWEMQAWDSINAVELNVWMENYVSTQVPGGESFMQLCTRVTDWYNANLHRLTNAIVVTHAGPIRCILSRVNQSPLADAFKLYPVKYGQVFTV